MIWGMENKDVQGRAGSTRRAFLSASAVTAVAAPLLSGTALAETDPALSRQAPDPGLRAMLRDIDPDRIKATILKLVCFGTRHTASSQTDPMRGIGAATNWVFSQMQAIAATSGGRMTVQKQSFTQPVASNIPVPTTITNVIATLKGTASPERFYVITGHLDSRVTDVLNFTSDAPGADDDGSGVAVVLELARLFATRQFPGTLVFATVAGEEQGLYGSAFMAAQMAAAGNDVQGMFSNDIVGASQAWDGTRPDPHTVRLFVEGIPTAVTQAQIATHAVGRRRERRGDAPAGPVRHRRGAVRADRHERPGDLAARPVPARQRPHLVPAAGLPGGQVHRAAGELQPRAPATSRSSAACSSATCRSSWTSTTSPGWPR